MPSLLCLLNHAVHTQGCSSAQVISSNDTNYFTTFFNTLQHHDNQIKDAKPLSCTNCCAFATNGYHIESPKPSFTSGKITLKNVTKNISTVIQKNSTAKNITYIPTSATQIYEGHIYDLPSLTWCKAISQQSQLYAT
jgi:hypothetical protein